LGPDGQQELFASCGAVDLGLSEKLVSRLWRTNAQEIQQVRCAIEQLDRLQQGDQEQQALAWYFLNFAQGYGYLIRSKESLSARPGWLTPQQLGSHLGVGGAQPHYLAVRPAPWSTWALIDIDEGSRYHPMSLDGEGDLPVKQALSTIGLSQPIEIQSSTSTGMHLLYPLAEIAKTWSLAQSMEQCLIAADLEIKPGVLELRPNCKRWDAQYQAIRAPLTGEGNSFWAPNYSDFGLHDDLVLFWKLFCQLRQHNRFKPMDLEHHPPRVCSPNRRGPVQLEGVLAAAQRRLKQGFTAPGQTNELTFKAQQIARLIEGIDSITELRNRCSELISQAPGFREFCGHQRQILNGSYWGDRTLRETLKFVPAGYIGTWRQHCNQQRADAAADRALRGIMQAVEAGLQYRSLNAAIAHLRAQGGPAASWWKHPKNVSIKQHLIEQLVTACCKQSEEDGPKSIAYRADHPDLESG
jgi:hypothetical protein